MSDDGTGQAAGREQRTERRPSEAGQRVHRALAEASVEGLMGALLVTCEPDDTLREVARRMARHRVHCVLVLHGPGAAGNVGAPWGILSDLDVVSAAVAGTEDVTAAEAASPIVTIVPADERLEVAARLMAERESHHVIVVEPGTERPVGILSALDIVRFLGREG